MQIFAESLRLESLLPGADLIINQAGQGMLSAALMHGKPLLMLPCDAETVLSAKQVIQLGAGRMALTSQEASSGDADSDADKLRAEIDSALVDQNLANAAISFAQSKRHPPANTQIDSNFSRGGQKP